MSSLVRCLPAERVVHVDAPDRDALLRALVDTIGDACSVPADDVYRAVIERETLCSTGFGEGLAMPHVRLPGARGFHAALGRNATGVDFAAPDGAPVRLALLIVGPESQKEGYLKLMGRAAKFLKSGRSRLWESDDLPGAVAELLTEA